MSGFRRIIPKFEEHATALGYLCLEWARLERHVHDLIQDIVGLDDNIADSIIPTDFREKLAALKNLAFLKKTSIEWFVSVSSLIDRIDQEVRPLRNRFVHDYWLPFLNDHPTKRQFRTRVTMPQSRQYEFSTSSDAVIPVDDIWNLTYRIDRSRMRLVLYMEHDPQADTFHETWT
jgi:hypothetical protein